MTYPDQNGTTLWGSNANGPVSWIVTVVSVLMLIVALYLYETREKASVPSKSPNATSEPGNPSPKHRAGPRKSICCQAFGSPKRFAALVFEQDNLTSASGQP
jgi:hypothetical protein